MKGYKEYKGEYKGFLFRIIIDLDSEIDEIFDTYVLFRSSLGLWRHDIKISKEFIEEPGFENHVSQSCYEAFESQNKDRLINL